MLMVVFGAGASHDSAPDLPTSASPDWERINRANRPPLTADLFQDKGEFHGALQEFRELHALIPDMRNLPGGTLLEQYLADLQAQAQQPGFEYLQRELAALRYYLHRILLQSPLAWYSDRAGITNYSALLHHIQDWQARTRERVALVTFNYDVLLDNAFASAIGFDPAVESTRETLEAYVGHEPFYLFKPHGSVNWVRLGNHLDAVTRGSHDVHALIANASKFEPTGDLEINWANDPVVSTRNPNVAVLPALAIPVNTKSTFECPDFHVQALSRMIPEVTHLLTIGWRASEESFLSLWPARSDLRIEVVSPGDPDTPAQNLAAAGINGEITLAKIGFTEYIRERRVRNFLDLS